MGGNQVMGLKSSAMALSWGTVMQTFLTLQLKLSIVVDTNIKIIEVHYNEKMKQWVYFCIQMAISTSPRAPDQSPQDQDSRANAKKVPALKTST
jgi:hypothetical protein